MRVSWESWRSQDAQPKNSSGPFAYTTYWSTCTTIITQSTQMPPGQRRSDGRTKVMLLVLELYHWQIRPNFAEALYDHSWKGGRLKIAPRVHTAMVMLLSTPNRTCRYGWYIRHDKVSEPFNLRMHLPLVLLLREKSNRVSEHMTFGYDTNLHRVAQIFPASPAYLDVFPVKTPAVPLK